MRRVAACIIAASGGLFLWNAAATSPEVPGPVAGSPVFVSFLASFDGSGATRFTVNATPADSSPLAYVWSLQDVSCGYLLEPAARSNQNGYFHGPSPTYPDGCPFAVETQTRVTVLVARAGDLDPTGVPRANAPYFTYSQVARAHDSSQTLSVDPAPALHYYGVGAAAPSPSGGPASTPATTGAGGFPVGVIIGIVAVGVAGGLGWFIVRHRGGGQVDLVHPYASTGPADLVHPFVETPPLPPLGPPEELPPPLPPATPLAPQPQEGTGTQEEDDLSGTRPDEDDSDDTTPPIFGPRLIDLPLGEPAPSDTPVEQPVLPPHEVFTPPPPPAPAAPAPSPPVAPVAAPPGPVSEPAPASAQPRLAKHCGPQVDGIFIEALNRMLSRLRTLFGTEPAMADGVLFLARNGGELDFWVLNPQTTCRAPHCPSTMTLCGRCCPPHLLSDIMYGFVGGYFDLDGSIAAGGIAYQLEKWLADIGGTNVKEPVSPQHLTEAQPAYQVGVRLGKACRRPQHEGRWHVTKDDLCAELDVMHRQTALLKVLLKDPVSIDCPPAPCVNTAADTDWSRKAWHWSMPLDETQHWAVSGAGL